ncbi:hypothetical protein JM658_16010 [Joostella atrarenae]|uniref:Uncharacterized protein n=1 Tax=Joostella atrarenae TaxID=679257 RepID=A0ABS9J7C8_9FLAO|nr:hypothetical protein [Joostella atrarenae]MCF8716335.1 hypothetical protein [Joostella atrarenae]
MNIKIFFIALLLTLSLSNVQAQSQTGINTQSPDPSAVLDITSTDKGILIPRVDLTSTTMDLDGDTTQATGLLVFNVGTVLNEGFYYWTGSVWTALDSKEVIIPEIDELFCEQATLEPQTFEAGTSFTGILKIPYSGGNGGDYDQGSPISSTGNTGLTATLKSGTLEFGNGFLVYDVSGTPSDDSPTGADFDVSFGTTNVINCIATVGNIETASLEDIATLGPLLDTNDNGVNGFHRVITSPDGKFSVRVFVPDNINLANADLQIRSNDEARSIMWNAKIGYVNGFIGSGNNSLSFSIPDMWYGNSGNDGSSEPITSNNNTAWSDADVYFNSPEQRVYMWTTTDVSEKTMYRLIFMMGAPSPNIPANNTNAANTKAYLYIQQVISAD